MRRTLIAPTALAFGLLAIGFAPAPVASAQPAPEVALTGIRQIAAGGAHTCALLSNGRVRCWGRNTSGQLGIGTRDEGAAPATVLNRAGNGPLTGVRQITAGNEHTCALLTDSRVVCWGENAHGQLGSGPRTGEDRLRPTPVQTHLGEFGTPSSGILEDVVEVVAGVGAATCARLRDQTAVCWGDGRDGQLGNGLTDDQFRPSSVRAAADGRALRDIVDLDVGAGHACAVLASTQVRCWGRNNHGQLGDNTARRRLRAVAVAARIGESGPLRGVRSIDLGANHTCAVLGRGQARCWGAGGNGRLGDDGTTDVDRPAIVTGFGGIGRLVGVGQVTAGNQFTCARVRVRQARCWGTNAAGQLGQGPIGGSSDTPVVVRNETDTGPLTDVVQISAGGLHVCVVLVDGQARCWGSGANHRLGDGTTLSSGVPVVVDA